MTKQEIARKLITKNRTGSYEKWVENISEFLQQYADQETQSLRTQLAEANKKSQCPCVYLDEPCQPHCTCKNGVFSHGCLYCATYGSIEQRKEVSKKIAEKIKSYQPNITRIQELESVIRELVELKDMKDKMTGPAKLGQLFETPLVEEYRKRKPLAWEAARAALKE